MASHHRNQVGVLLGDWLVPVFPAPCADCRQRAGVTALRRYLAHDVIALLRLAPYVAEAEEGERRAIRFRMRFPIWSFEAKVDEARLVGMERKLVPSKSLPRTPKTRWASRKSSNAITGRVAERSLTSPPSQIRTGRSRVIRLLP
jgi:hypothetical protein